MSEKNTADKAYFHLPGLFEFYEFYKVFLPLFKEYREYFYDGCDIGSIYGAPEGCIFNGGRFEAGEASTREVLELLGKYDISARLTFSNSCISQKHLSDTVGNELLRSFETGGCGRNGVIVHSEALLGHIRENYPALYLVSSTTKVITDFDLLRKELERDEFDFVVPDFRLNKAFGRFEALPESHRAKLEMLCNECCDINCAARKECYENVSRRMLGENCPEFTCRGRYGSEGYVFSRAMENESFISPKDIREKYMPRGINQFKLEGRGLGSALLLEILLYYMVKEDYRLKVREAIYLDSMLDLF